MRGFGPKEFKIFILSPFYCQQEYESSILLEQFVFKFVLPLNLYLINKLDGSIP